MKSGADVGAEASGNNKRLLAVAGVVVAVVQQVIPNDEVCAVATERPRDRSWRPSKQEG